MTHQPQLDALIAYIRQQSQTTDHAAIRQHLLQSGADPHLVDQAFAQVSAPEPAAQPAPLASQAPGDPDSVGRIRAYLEQHRQTYTRDALRQKLLDDGHDQQAVDLAITQVYGFQVQASGAAPARSPTTQIVLIAIGLFIFNYVFWSIGAAIALNSSAAGLWIIPAVLLLEIIAAVVARSRNRTVSRGLIWGIAISLLPIVALALLFGICLAILGTSF